MRTWIGTCLVLAFGFVAASCAKKKEQAPPEPAKTPRARAVKKEQIPPRPRVQRVTPPRKPAQPGTLSLNFDVGTPGSLPAGLEGRTGKWALAQDPKAHSGKGVLAQLAKSEDAAFNVLLVTGHGYKDLEASVWLQAVKGKVDQGGGLVWRAKDEKNYYVARYNPLEDNLRLYYVKDGHRKMIAGLSLRIDHKAWHHMVVTMKGSHITVSLDGKKYLEKDDSTFPGAGMVGLWTKSDARTYFDDFSARPLATPAQVARPGARTVPSRPARPSGAAKATATPPRK